MVLCADGLVDECRFSAGLAADLKVSVATLEGDAERWRACAGYRPPPCGRPSRDRKLVGLLLCAARRVRGDAHPDQPASFARAVPAPSERLGVTLRMARLRAVCPTIVLPKLLPRSHRLRGHFSRFMESRRATPRGSAVKLCCGLLCLIVGGFRPGSSAMPAVGGRQSASRPELDS